MAIVAVKSLHVTQTRTTSKDLLEHVLRNRLDENARETVVRARDRGTRVGRDNIDRQTLKAVGQTVIQVLYTEK